MLGLLWFPLTALGSTLLFAFLKLFRRLMWRRKTDARHLKTWMMAPRLETTRSRWTFHRNASKMRRFGGLRPLKRWETGWLWPDLGHVRPWKRGFACRGELFPVHPEGEPAAAHQLPMPRVRHQQAKWALKACILGDFRLFLADFVLGSTVS